MGLIGSVFGVKCATSPARKGHFGTKITNRIFYFSFVWIISTTYLIFSQINDFHVVGHSTRYEITRIRVEDFRTILKNYRGWANFTHPPR